MKCRVCGKPASISLKSYNTALCAKDFTSFFEKRVLSTINKYSLIDDNDAPIVAVSGGKDSLALWHIINKLGFPADGVYVDLGIEGYSDISLSKIKIMADMLKRKVFIFPMRNVIEKGIDDLSRTLRRAPCSTCGMIKRYAMNRICIEKNYSVLMTGHNLDDEASALFGNILYWKDEYLWKKGVLLEGRAGRLSKKVKPLFLCSEREAAAYAIINGIDYVYEECPFSVDAKSLLYKSILNRLEELSPATKIGFIKGYLRAAKKHKSAEGENEDREGGDCKVCGYPTYGEKCSICRIMEKFEVKNKFYFEEYDPCCLDSHKKIVT